MLDDEFVRAARVKEASGRARMLSARWQNEPPPDSGPNLPVAEIRRSWFGRRARRVDGGRRWRRGLRNALLLLLIPALLLVAVAYARTVKSDFAKSDAVKSSALPTLGAATATPSSAPPSVAPQTATVEHPWAGSPAEAWPSGPDGLALPAATAVGVFGPEQVAADLDVVKQFLVAANMDPKVLAGGYPQAALDLTNRSTADALAEDLAHPSEEHDPSNWLSRFDPAWAVPVTDQVKVQGLISFEGDGEQGLLVHTDVTFVYAARPGPEVGKAAPSKQPSQPSQPAPTGGGTGAAKPVGWVQDTPGAVDVEREIVRRKFDFRFADPARFQVKKGKLSVAHSYSDLGNNLCGFHGGYLRPSFDADWATVSARPSDGPSAGPTTDPYDWSRPLTESGECGSISRS
ncbi:hypothetical protein AB0K51_06930 [Kitasatospora sp. NPDC049285]|uniref:SCO2583/SCO2584 N-terminal domain-containing protein n=1 Tax=Kitasatospora sp. NPDC049285 TaxID=3157096 RepID=UPI00342AE7EB